MSATWLDAAALNPDLEIVGLVDLDQDTARNRCREFSLEGAFLGPHLAPALEATNPDVVFDVTVPSAHKDVTITALKHGCLNTVATSSERSRSQTAWPMRVS